MAPLSPSYFAEYNGQPLISVSIALIVLQTIVLALYIKSRALLKSDAGIEAWYFMPLGFLSSIGQCIVAILKVKIGGTGRHITYYLLVDPNTIIRGTKLQVAQNYIYGLSVTFPKFMILILYLRVFRGKWVRRLTWTVAIFLALYIIGTIIATSLLCRPLAYNWDKTIPNGHCANKLAAYRYVSIPNIVSDIAIIVLPIPTLWKLHLPIPKKVGVALTFLTGGFGIITAIIRFIRFFARNVDPDFTYYGVDIECWAIVEPAAYFVCACMPGLRPLLRSIAQSEPYSRCRSISIVGRWLRLRSSASAAAPAAERIKDSDSAPALPRREGEEQQQAAKTASVSCSGPDGFKVEAGTLVREKTELNGDENGWSSSPSLEDGHVELVPSFADRDSGVMQRLEFS